MDKQKVIAELSGILEQAQAAVVATVGPGEVPHVRWVSPVLLKHLPGSIFMISAPAFDKVRQVRENRRVEWLFQTPALDRIITVRGVMSLVDSVALRNEVLQAAGSRLRTFWTVNHDKHEIVVLETVVDEAVVFVPYKGSKESVSFS